MYSEDLIKEIRIELMILLREVFKKQVDLYNKKMTETINKEKFQRYKSKRDLYTKLLENLNEVIIDTVINEVIRT